MNQEDATQMLQRPLHEVLENHRSPVTGEAKLHKRPEFARILGPRERPRSLDLKTLYEPVSREQVALSNQLLSLGRRSGRGLLDTVQDVIREISGLDGLRLDLHGMAVHRNIEKTSWRGVGHASLTRLELPPEGSYGVMSVDQSLVDPVLGAMLGEATGGVRRTVGLSSRDHGLFGWVLLNVLDALVRELQFPPFVFSVEPPSRHECEVMLSKGNIVEVVFLASFKSCAGFVRFWFPEVLVRKFSAVWPEAEGRAQQAQLGRVSGSELGLSVGLAHVVLGQVDLWELQVGDVVMPSEHGLCDAWSSRLGIQEKGQGMARLYLDMGCERYVPVSLTSDDTLGQWACELEDVSVRELKDTEKKGEIGMAEGAHSESSAYTAHLLKEAQVELEVRFASVGVKVDDLAGLMPGQVLSLGMPIGEPVELVAGRQVIGTGELVNIEGRLGVRVLSKK